jgi:hypothetical protein
MGTGAVYVTLSGLKVHPGPITHIETVFFFINLSLFILNSSTLLVQALCAILVLPVWRPVSLWMCHSISTTVQTANQRSSQGCLRSPHSEPLLHSVYHRSNCRKIGVVVCHDRYRNHQLRSYTGALFPRWDIRTLLVNDFAMYTHISVLTGAYFDQDLRFPVCCRVLPHVNDLV